MNNEYVKTLVMDMAPELATDELSAGDIADKLQAPADDQNSAASEFKFTQSHSYLT